MAAPQPQPRPKPTPAEVRLAEQYLRVLDFVSRCATAIQGGDWFYLYDKAGQLQKAVTDLEAATGQTWQAIQRGAPRPREEVVRAIVARHGRHYRAGRLLHPPQPDPDAQALQAIGRHVAARLDRYADATLRAISGEYQSAGEALKSRVEELHALVPLLPDAVRAELEVRAVLGEEAGS